MIYLVNERDGQIHQFSEVLPTYKNEQGPGMNPHHVEGVPQTITLSIAHSHESLQNIYKCNILLVNVFSLPLNIFAHLFQSTNHIGDQY